MNEKGTQSDVKAFIQNDKVSIWVDKSQKPVEVLYSWEPYTDANLINEVKLPASTFQLKIK